MFAGTTVRKHGLGLRVDSDTNEDLDEPLLRTGERMHLSVRVRLACKGLGLDDEVVWKREALKDWKLERGSGLTDDEERSNRYDGPAELGYDETLYPTDKLYRARQGDDRWRWVYQTQPAGHGEDQMP